MRSGEPGRFPGHIAAGLEPHQPARLYYSYFPPKRQLLLEQLVQWLVQVEKGFRGTLDFAYALMLLCEEATLLRYSSDHFAINWYRSGFSILEQGEPANSLYLVFSPSVPTAYLGRGEDAQLTEFARMNGQDGAGIFCTRPSRPEDRNRVTPISYRCP